MTRKHDKDTEYRRHIRQILIGALVLALAGAFALWRIDNPRAERFRQLIMNQVIPGFEWSTRPLSGLARMLGGFDSYARIYQQNQELRREVQSLKAWRERALELEQTNAKLLKASKARLHPGRTYITSLVIADSGSPFRQSVLLNVGSEDGVRDGWAALDGLGLIGRVSGVGRKFSRVLLLADTSSRIPVTIEPSGEKALMIGDNSIAPPAAFVNDPANVKAGDRVVTSGDGGVFPPGILVGSVVVDKRRQIRIRLVADYRRLEFVRVLRGLEIEEIRDAGEVIIAPDVYLPAETAGAGGVFSRGFD